MPKFFENFPVIDYKLSGDGKTRVIPNILNRFQPIQEVLNKVSLFYPHTIRDGQTPEMISDIYYGTVEYDWIILEFNRIKDRYFDWPMSNDVFETYIENKYGSEQYAKQTVKYYYHDISRKEILPDGRIIPEIKNIINQEIYATLDDQERSLEYIYDWEDRLNEDKRQIKIIDSIYISQILKEKEAILNG